MISLPRAVSGNKNGKWCIVHFVHMHLAVHSGSAVNGYGPVQLAILWDHNGVVAV
jgi:hypothetical protein